MSTDLDDTLVARVLNAAYSAAGVSFRKRTFHKVAQPILRASGRSDMNYGSWVGKDGSRPLLPDPNGIESSDAILRISPKWVERLSLDPTNEIDEEAAELNAQMLTDTGETFDDYLPRKTRDPKQ